MKQSIAQKISNATLDYRDGESRLLIELPMDISKMAKALKEQVTKKIEGDHLGCRLIFVVAKRNKVLDSYIGSVLMDLEQSAFEDKKVFDYLEVLRVRAETKEDEAIVVEIVELTPKREVWI